MFEKFKSELARMKAETAHMTDEEKKDYARKLTFGENAPKTFGDHLRRQLRFSLPLFLLTIAGMILMLVLGK